MSSDKVILLKIGKHIAELRKQKGYTQRKLAEKLYVGEKTISKWERGVIAPDITMIKLLSKEFNVSADELLNGEKSKDPNNSSTIDVINAYTNQTKHKVLKRVLIIASIIIFLLLSMYLIERHYRWNITNLESYGEFEIHGYAFSNNKETKIVINKIIFDDQNAGLNGEIKIKNINLEILSNDEIICYNQNKLDKEESLYEFFNDYSFVCDSKKKINLKNISLHIIYYENDNIIRKEYILN